MSAISPGASSREAVVDSSSRRGGIKVWDLPTRVFHWLLVACVTAAVVTAQLGGNWMEWHLRAGIATLSLLAFRIVWGIAGPRYARFVSFIYGPRALWRHFTDGADSQHRYAGHSPSGSLSVFALLLLLGSQAVSGLFSSDFMGVDGPLVSRIEEATATLVTSLHVNAQWFIYGLVALHVLAIAYYRLIRKIDLLTPMVTGFKHGLVAPHASDSLALRLIGLAMLAACATLAFWWLA